MDYEQEIQPSVIQINLRDIICINLVFLNLSFIENVLLIIFTNT